MRILPPAARNLFEKRFLDLQKLFIKGCFNRPSSPVKSIDIFFPFLLYWFNELPEDKKMMDYRYQVNITKPEGSASLRVSWQDMEKQVDTSFEVPASPVMKERLKSWRKPMNRLAAGQELFKLLDGCQGYFSRLLEKAGRENRIPLVYIKACRETEDWPFELAAQGNRFLVPTAVHLVRCVSHRGVDSKPMPEDRPLKLLFMACSARDVTPELDFEKEEETIFKVTGNLAIHLEVEDSGSLEGLKNKLALEKYDILHLTGHAGIDAKGRAFFIMEDETGYRRDVYAEELYHEALKENMPRLVFLSGCRTGETREGDETVCFCRELVGAGFGNPRLMEWLDRLLEEMGQAEVEVLLEKVKGKKEEFIKEHVPRELLRKGGEEFGRLLGMLGVYRVPVLKEGVKAMGEKWGIKEWEVLLARGVGYSVVEFYAQERSYGVTPLLREELEAAKKKKEEKELCHRAGMEYFQWLKQEKEKNEDYDPMVVEELIYHALGSGEEEIAAAEGGGLVSYLNRRLAFMEAQRVGEWILREKKEGLSGGNDAILLNNLGSAYFELDRKDLARPYFEKALEIFTHFFGTEHPYYIMVKEWLDACR
jgi:tetratricopeptide (TPR) repeat protein